MIDEGTCIHKKRTVLRETQWTWAVTDWKDTRTCKGVTARVHTEQTLELCRGITLGVCPGTLMPEDAFFLSV